MSLPDDKHTPHEALAEAVVFAHESETMPVTSAELAAFERVAGLAAAVLAERTPPPERLKHRLAAAGLAFCAEQSRPASTDRRAKPGFTTSLERHGRHRLWTGMLAGGAAAAAAFWLWFAGPTRNELDALRQRLQQAEQRLAQFEPHESDLRNRRAEALAQGTAVLHRHWQPGPSPRHGDVHGDVVWSHERQDGWLTFRGLPKLDSDHAYQLWIVDARRDGPPVDGGLFTISDPKAETLVPIHAQLRIDQPAAFVITIEPKDGVVVSKREHIVAIADS